MSEYLKHTWIKQMTTNMQMLYPEADATMIEELVAESYKEHYKDHKAIIYNNYENTIADTSLGEVLDWIQQEKPLIAESGVFFHPKDKKRNVNTEIIKECMLDARDIHKKEKFDYMDAGDTFMAAVKDIQQANDKKAANSGYGAEGQSSSFLYNIHSAMSVTACGRGQLSTAAQCFDNLLADYMKFFNMDEFFTWVNNIKSEKTSWKFDTYDVIDHIPSKKEFTKRFMRKFLHHTFADKDMIEKVYDALPEELMIRVYYKANIHEFLNNFKPMKIYSDIGMSDCEFIDPNKIPEKLYNNVTLLTELVTEFVNYKHSVFRYEDRTKYQKRSTVIILDTDSNFLYYGGILKYIMDKILPMRLFKSKKEKQTYKLRVLNVISCFASAAIGQTLYNYLGHVNVAPEDRKYIKMKNEFYYERVIITHAKKSYIGLQLRQEAIVFKEPVLDVKGVNFFKSTATEKTSKFIYDEILMNQLLRPKNGKVSLKATYRTIDNFKKQIADDIAQGDIGFLKRSIRVKSSDAYANPMGIGQYKAVYVWNQVNTDVARIDLPATVTLVKVQLRNKQDVAKLANFPDIYKKMLHLFETNPDIGDHIVKDADGKEKLAKGSGIKAIALPVEFDTVPEWLLAIIDVETIVSDNMKLFTQLYRPLGMSNGKSTHNGASTEYYTNIVRI